MPYRNDPRGRVTLNLPAAEYAALAGYASPGTFALALVRARGGSLAPVVVVDANGARQVALLQEQLAAATEALASCHTARTAQAMQLQAVRRELEQRPTLADVHHAVAVAMDHRAAAAAATASSTTAAETIRAQRRQARRGAGEPPGPM